MEHKIEPRGKEERFKQPPAGEESGETKPSSTRAFWERDSPLSLKALQKPLSTAARGRNAFLFPLRQKLFPSCTLL